jgi:hypothetical protein
MIVLIDCNVLMDVAEKRRPHYAAANQLLCRCRRGEIQGLVAFHSLANLAYRYKRPVWKFLRKLLPRVTVAADSADAILKGMTWGMKDFEDVLQGVAAQSGKAQFIITRNVKDFKFGPLPAMSPADYLDRFH